MHATRRTVLHGALATLLAPVLFSGCEDRGDAITAAERADARAGIAAPGIAETRAIAEEGFIYGLPIVMSYAVMYEYAIDRSSGQFKAPSTRSRTSRACTPTRTRRS